MTECPVPYIDFGLFWKISAVVLVPSLIPLANLILTALGKVEELKAKIRSSIGRDESGVPYRLPAAKREVLNELSYCYGALPLNSLASCFMWW